MSPFVARSGHAARKDGAAQQSKAVGGCISPDYKSLLGWAEGRDLRSLRSGQPRPGECKVVPLVRQVTNQDGQVVGKVATHSGTVNPLETYLYYLIAPDTGTHDIVVSYSALNSIDAVWVASASYTGVSQGGLDASAVSADDIFPATSATGTVTTVADNDWVVMGSYSGDGNTSAGAGTTIRATSPTLDRQVLSDSGGDKHPAGSVTLTVNGNSDRVGTITAAVAPVNLGWNHRAVISTLSCQFLCST